MKRRSFLTAGLSAAAFFPAAARAQFHGFQQRLTIGVNAPLSGPGQEAGQEMIAGVQIAVDFANQYTPMLNSAFAVRTFDTQNQYAQLVNNVQFAAADPSVLALVTGFDGDAIERAEPTFANTQMPVLVPATTADRATGLGYRCIWRLPTKDSMEGQLVALYISGRHKPKFALAVSQEDVYGADVMNGFTNQAHSSKLDADGYVFPSKNPDFAAAAARIMSRSPDFIFLCGSSALLGPIVPALRTAGFSGKFAACEGFYNLDAAKAYGDAFSGGFVSSSFPPLDRLSASTQALMDFKSRANVTIVSAFAYAAAQIVMGAVRRTAANNRLAALSALQTPSAYSTILGQFIFSQTGDPVDPNLYFYTIDKGGFSYDASSHPSAFSL